MLTYPILVMTFLVSPQAHSSVSLSCPCNDTKGWGDCARECCLGIARLCCSKNPETEPLKDRLHDQSLPKAAPIPSGESVTPPSVEEMAVSPLPVPHPARGKPKTAAPLNATLASVRPAKRSVITTVKGDIEAGEEAEIMGGVMRGGGARSGDLSIRTSVGGSIRATGKSKVTLGSEVG